MISEQENLLTNEDLAKFAEAVSDLVSQDSGQEITIWIMFLLIVSGSFFGGVVENLRSVKVRDAYYEMDEEALSIKRIFLSAFLSGLVGVGGGFAAALGIILMGELPKSDNNESILFVFSLCLVAGFAARRLLPEMSDQLMDRLSRAEGTSREALKEAEETSILSRARATVGAKRTGVELDKCINDLVGLRATEPNDRESAILLGRCFRLKGDLEGAISALDSFLKRKEKAKEYDDDFADVLFNKACYLSLLAEPEQGDQKTSEAHAKQAFSVLQRSIEYSPTNLDDAIHDDDLRMVRELPEFQELLTKKRP